MKEGGEVRVEMYNLATKEAMQKGRWQRRDENVTRNWASSLCCLQIVSMLQGQEAS